MKGFIKIESRGDTYYLRKSAIVCIKCEDRITTIHTIDRCIIPLDISIDDVPGLLEQWSVP